MAVYGTELEYKKVSRKKLEVVVSLKETRNREFGV